MVGWEVYGGRARGREEEEIFEVDRIGSPSTVLRSSSLVLLLPLPLPLACSRREAMLFRAASLALARV